MANRIIKEIKHTNSFLPQHKRLKVCAYVRVSTDNIGQLSSLNNQTEYYNNKLSSNPDYEFCGIYSDSGISGVKENRPGFQAMMDKAKTGEVDFIYTKSISRFARNTVLLLRYVRDLKDAGVGVIFEEQNINTLSSDGELMMTVLAAIAEEERKVISENIKWSVQSKFKSGKVMVDANRLLGYDKNKDGTLVINEEQAQIVRQIFKLYLDGCSGYRIAQLLNKEGVPIYTAHPWSSHRVLRIISNEKYAGDCLMQKSYIDERGKQVINRGQKVMYHAENTHAAIVSRSDWERAQEIRKGRIKKEYPFTGLLKCGYCGASLIHVIHVGGYTSWICATYMRDGKSACIGMRISNGKLLELIKDIDITEPMVLEEINHEQNKKSRSKKDFRLIPSSKYTGHK